MSALPRPATPRLLADLVKGQRARVVALDEAGVATPLAAGEIERFVSAENQP